MVRFKHKFMIHHKRLNVCCYPLPAICIKIWEGVATQSYFAVKLKWLCWELSFIKFWGEGPAFYDI